MLKKNLFPGLKKLGFLLLTFSLLISPIAKVIAQNTANAPASAPTTLATQTTITPASALTSIPTLIPAPPELKAKAYILMDAKSGAILAAKNADAHLPPASLTKLMSLYLIADALKTDKIKFDDQVPISKRAWHMPGSRMFAKVGSTVPVNELIKGIAIASGNDATVAMAEYIGGTESAFVDLMNQTAAILSMHDTHYEDSNGLPANNHYSSAHDIATLSRAWILNFPEYYPWFKEKWVTHNGIRQPNRNRLLWRDPSVDGMKTGHTSAAGYCLDASALRNGMRLIAVVMGTASDSARTNYTAALLNYGFRFFESHKLYAANIALLNPRVWYGENKTVPLGLSSDFYVTIPKGQYKNLKLNIQLTGKLKAPIKKGQICGNIIVNLNHKTIATRPLIALQDDPEGGFWSRLWDRIGSWL